MKRLDSAGYSLIELMVALAIGAILLAVTIPAFKHYTSSSDLKSASRSIASQLSLAREKAIATGQTQTIRFMKDYGGTSDYHIWSNNVASPSWRLPKGVDYVWSGGTVNTYHMTNDGRCQDEGLIILVNPTGDRDTVSVRLSGMVMVY